MSSSRFFGAHYHDFGVCSPIKCCHRHHTFRSRPFQPSASLQDLDIKPSTTCLRRELLLAAVVLPSLLGRGAQAADPTTTQTIINGGVTTLVSSEDVVNLSPAERQLYQFNKRAQGQNRVPEDFPVFIREGYNIKVIADDYQVSPEGLIYRDFEVGRGLPPQEGQQVMFDYTGYNESGTVIDSTYRQQRSAVARLGIGGLIPGFELGIKTMKVGGKRRIVVPPELGPPVGPSTFFSAKQCEVFDIALMDIKNCSRKQTMMFSTVVCE